MQASASTPVHGRGRNIHLLSSCCKRSEVMTSSVLGLPDGKMSVNDVGLLLWQLLDFSGPSYPRD